MYSRGSHIKLLEIEMEMRLKMLNQIIWSVEYSHVLLLAESSWVCIFVPEGRFHSRSNVEGEVLFCCVWDINTSCSLIFPFSKIKTRSGNKKERRNYAREDTETWGFRKWTRVDTQMKRTEAMVGLVIPVSLILLFSECWCLPPQLFLDMFSRNLQHFPLERVLHCLIIDQCLLFSL